jgi:gliding motility-associated-like protein
VRKKRNNKFAWGKLRFFESIFKEIFLLIAFFSIAVNIYSQKEQGLKNETSKLITTASVKGFVRNYGQIAAMEGGRAKNVLYAFHSSSDVSVYITSTGLSYVYQRLLDKKNIPRNKLSAEATGKMDSNTVFHFAAERIDVNLIRAHINSSNVETEYIEQSALFNYYNANTAIEDQRLIKKIIFKNVYPGIDWALYINDNASQKIKYDFIVHANADAEQIKITYSSNANIYINKDSGININSKLGFIKEGRPIIYSTTTSNYIPVCYKIKHNTITYNIDKRLANTAYTIDPDLVWGTFLHTGTGYEGISGSTVRASDIETDAQGNIFVALGCSGIISFPTVNPGGGAYFSSIYDSVNGCDVYMKFDANRRLLWSTYFASGGKRPQITVNNKGELITAGSYHYGSGLPYKNNGGFFDSTSVTSGYLAKFSNNGNLLWCSSFGEGDPAFTDITSDNNNNVYITGYAYAIGIPKKDPGNGAFISTESASVTIFITKFNDNCDLVWSTPIGGSDNDGSRIAVDKYNNLYLLGQTIRSEFPLKDAGGYFRTAESLSTIAKFNQDCQLVWSTYLPCFGHDVTADSSGNVFVVGLAYGDWFEYVDPGNGAYADPEKGSYRQGGCIMRFDQQTKLTWATTYFNSKNFWFNYIVFEKFRNLIHIYGIMNDDVSGLPTMNDACNGSYYYSSLQPNNFTDPLILTFTTGGKCLYASLNGFPYAYYDIAECAVDNKGNLFFVFGEIQEVPPLNKFPALKDPGNGAYYEKGSNNYLSEASFIMQLKPTDLNADTSYTVPQNCNCNGILTVIPYCGSGNYKYQWNRGDTTASIKNVCPGNYTVKLTDLNSYSDTLIHFYRPNPPGNIHGAKLATTGEHCNKSDGTLLVSNIHGGPSPYSYSLNDQPYTTSPVFNNLNAGNYFINIKDKDGCVFSDSANIAAITGPSNIYTSISYTACNKTNGSIVVDSIKGGTAPFVYSINNNATGTKNSFDNLAAGKYAVIVYDSALCSLEDSVMVGKAQPPSTFKMNITDAHCDQLTGSIRITDISGGTAPFLYSIDSSNFITGNSFINLADGTGKIFIKDANGCLASDSFSIHNIPGPQKIVFTGTDALCGTNTGRIIVNSVQPGTPPFQYKVNDVVYSPNPVFNDVLPGTAIIYVKDAFNCSVVDSTIIKSSDALKIKIIPADTMVCITQKLTFTALLSSNSKGVQYYWNNSMLSSGTYSNSFYSNTNIQLSAKDEDGCTASANAQITVKYCDSMLANCIVFPDAFTPNHDGLNDYFGAQDAGCKVYNYKLLIYNRWGGLVFKTNDVLKRWDGTLNALPVPMGAFIYYNEWQDASGVIRKHKGTVMLIR